MIEHLKIKSIKRIKQHIPVYNISVKDNKNYWAHNILVHNCDDPNSASDNTSQIKLENVSRWFDQVFSTRLNNPKKDVKIVVQQRIHEKEDHPVCRRREDRAGLAPYPADQPLRPCLPV